MCISPPLKFLWGNRQTALGRSKVETGVDPPPGRQPQPPPAASMDQNQVSSTHTSVPVRGPAQPRRKEAHCADHSHMLGTAMGIFVTQPVALLVLTHYRQGGRDRLRGPQ